MLKVHFNFRKGKNVPYQNNCFIKMNSGQAQALSGMKDEDFFSFV